MAFEESQPPTNLTNYTTLTILRSNKNETSSVTCRLCLNSTSKSELQEHIITCKLKLAAECQSCRQWVLKSEHLEHEELCKGNMVQCQFCRNWFNKSQLKRHEDSCQKFELVYDQKTPTFNINKTPQMENNEGQCKVNEWMYQQKSPIISNKKKKKKIKRRSKPSPVISPDLTDNVCNFCKRWFCKDELQVHEKLCRQKMEQCQFCLDWFKLVGLGKHERSCTKNQKVLANNLTGMNDMSLCQTDAEESITDASSVPCAEALQNPVTNMGRKSKSKSKQRPFSCILCNKRFTLKATLQKHNKRYHQYVCVFCCQAFQGQYDLNKHEFFCKQCHPLKPTWKCDICNTLFSSKQNLHQVLHGERTQLICKICHGGSLYSKHLEQCKKMLGKETVAKCPHCSWEYIGDGSAMQTAFIEHKKSCVHQQKEQFSCTLCEAQFTYKRTMQYHMKSVHGKLLNCTVCKAEFKQEQELRRHMQMHREQLSVAKTSEKDIVPALRMDGNIIVIQPETQNDITDGYQTPNLHFIKCQANPGIPEECECEAKVKPETDSGESSDINSESNTFLVKSEADVLYFQPNL